MASRERNQIDPEHSAILDRYITDYPVKLGQLARELGVSIKVSSG